MCDALNSWTSSWVNTPWWLPQACVVDCKMACNALNQMHGTPPCRWVYHFLHSLARPRALAVAAQKREQTTPASSTSFTSWATAAHDGEDVVVMGWSACSLFRGAIRGLTPHNPASADVRIACEGLVCVSLYEFAIRGIWVMMGLPSGAFGWS